MENFNYEERFSRLRLIIGREGLESLEKSTVMVLGIGGVGASCAEALARGGVARLILLDGDIVEESNINRQALAFSSTIGKVKTDVMEAMIYEINPSCQVIKQNIFLDKENTDMVLSSLPRPDYVIDCLDTVTAKLRIASWCGLNQVPLLASMGAANKLDPCQLKFSYIEDTFNCSLSAVIRRECRRRGIKKLEVLFSTESPLKKKNPENGEKNGALGTMSYMPPIMGQILAGKVIQRLVGLEEKALAPMVEIREEDI